MHDPLRANKVIIEFHGWEGVRREKERVYCNNIHPRSFSTPSRSYRNKWPLRILFLSGHYFFASPSTRRFHITTRQELELRCRYLLYCHRLRTGDIRGTSGKLGCGINLDSRWGTRQIPKHRHSPAESGWPLGEFSCDPVRPAGYPDT